MPGTYLQSICRMNELFLLILKEIIRLFWSFIPKRFIFSVLQNKLRVKNTDNLFKYYEASKMEELGFQTRFCSNSYYISIRLFPYLKYYKKYVHYITVALKMFLLSKIYVPRWQLDHYLKQWKKGRTKIFRKYN